MRSWRDRLRAVARAYPDDPGSPGLLYAAARLFLRLDPVEAVDSAFREVAYHPQARGPDRIYALRFLALREPPRTTLEQILADWNSLIDEVARLNDPLRRRSFQPVVDMARFFKAYAVQTRYAHGEQVDPDTFPPPDRGKRASDLWLDYIEALDRSPWTGVRRTQQRLIAMRHRALSLAYEGAREEALNLFEQVRSEIEAHAAELFQPVRSDDLGRRPAGWAQWIELFARTVWSHESASYVRFLESQEAQWPFAPTEWLPVSYSIGRWYFQRGSGAPLLLRLSDLLEEPAPEALHLLRETRGVTAAELTLELGRACLLADVEDHPQAVTWLLRSLDTPVNTQSRYTRREAIRLLLDLAEAGDPVELATLEEHVRQFVTRQPDDPEAAPFLERLNRLAGREKETAADADSERNPEDLP